VGQEYPTGQRTGLDVFVAQNDPTGQGEQLKAPVESEYEPEAHAVGFVISFVGQYDPVGHAIGADETDGQYEPAGQTVQALTPVDVAYRPDEHEEQVWR
jgi:hypothetical protein